MLTNDRVGLKSHGHIKALYATMLMVLALSRQKELVKGALTVTTVYIVELISLLPVTGILLKIPDIVSICDV